MKKLLAAVAIAALGLAPVASFADDSEVNVADTLYVDADGPGVWQESNGIAGLQTTASEAAAADTHLA